MLDCECWTSLLSAAKGGGRENAIRRRKSDIYRLPCWLTELRFNVPQNRPFWRCFSHPVLLSTNIIGLSHIYLMVHNLHVCIFTFIYGLELVCIWPLLACDSVIYYCDIISTITLLIMPWGNLVSNWPGHQCTPCMQSNALISQVCVTANRLSFPDFASSSLQAGCFNNSFLLILVKCSINGRSLLSLSFTGNPRDAMLAWYLPSSCVCLFVCLSVTSRCSTKMAKLSITQTTSCDSPGTLAFSCQ